MRPRVPPQRARAQHRGIARHEATQRPAPLPGVDAHGNLERLCRRGFHGGERGAVFRRQHRHTGEAQPIQRGLQRGARGCPQYRPSNGAQQREPRRSPRDGRMAFIRTPDGISIELLQAGGSLPPAEPWTSMPNPGSW